MMWYAIKLPAFNPLGRAMRVRTAVGWRAKIAVHLLGSQPPNIHLL
jgi:hypothetical protein